MPSHLIVFDLDGTLVDSRRDLARSANLLLAEHGAAPLAVEEVTAMVGEGARVLVRRVLGAAGLVDTVDVQSALDRFLAIYDEHLLDETRLYPGIEEVLDAIDGRAAVALLTNKPARHTGRMLVDLGIRPRFSEVIGGDGAFARKPDPAGLLHLIKSADVPTGRTVMVGDSMVDVETARRAGTHVCVARYGFGHLPDNLAAAPGVIEAHDPADLAPLLLAFLSA